jgi:hypothetical protein
MPKSALSSLLPANSLSCCIGYGLPAILTTPCTTR